MTFTVTKAFGHVSTRKVEAPTRQEAERRALAACGFSCEARA